jgi:hypothetical protein
VAGGRRRATRERRVGEEDRSGAVAGASAAKGARGSAATDRGQRISDIEIPARCCFLSRAAGVPSFVESAVNVSEKFLVLLDS